MRVGELDILPSSGSAGTIDIAHELVEANDDIDKLYIIDAVCGSAKATERIFVEGRYEVLEASDGVLTDVSDSDLWVPKQKV